MLFAEQIKDNLWKQHKSKVLQKESSLVLQKWELHWTKTLVRTKKTKNNLEQENKTLTVKLVSDKYIFED